MNRGGWSPSGLVRVSKGVARGALFVALLCGSRTNAFASNVTEVPDNGSEQMGRGGAWVARASDPLATTFNPAGLAGQPTRLTLQNSFLFQHTCMTRLKAANDTSQTQGIVDATGHFPRVCNDVEMTFNPQIGGTLRVTEKLGIGLLVIGPASAGEKNFPELVEDSTGARKAAPQRYLLTRQAGLVLFPTLGVGYEVLPNLRIGASFGWGIAKLKNAASTVALANDGQSPDNDVQAVLQVKDYFIPRVSAGALLSLTPELDFAGWYQWTDTIRATGDVGSATSYYTQAVARGDKSGVRYADTIFEDCGTGRAQDAGKCGSGDNAKVTFVLPMEAKLGIRYHKPRVSLEEAQSGEGGPIQPGYRRDPLANDIFDAELDLTWANNSAIDAIEVRFPSDTTGAGKLPVAGINSTIPPNADQPKQYKDTFGVRVGGDVNVIPDKLAIRAGAFFESSAAREQFQHIDFAPSQRIGFALGGTYRIRLSSDVAKTNAIEIMVGYGHTFFADQSREDPNASGIGAIAGTPCPGDATQTGPGKCSDGSQPYRTRWPVNLGTITNSLNVINVGASYRF